MSRQLTGSPAPPLELPTPNGTRRSLEEFRGRSAVVSFLGASNCLFCRAHVIRLIQAREAIATLGSEVIFVVYNDPELVMSQMFRALDLPYVVLIDPERTAYAAWGLAPATLRAKLAPGLYWATLRMALRVMSGREQNPGPAPDRGQLGGDFVVDRAGRLSFVNRMKSFHDRADVSDLLAALRAG
jgi:peroxiredoxin